ncbi:efflux RND transporter periplasmic adaptor subunit [Rhizobium sp. Root482]|uniref:efflux RND transporter periplasmic adaptor subunit n=1 Tax=Rhizobium sp. Root482 TaxID=1736543 RepID=UPI0007005A04|nr:efflux RND transporter periplasmic adaptor subunit [Rhizobium sp. Root482]KQY13845.1 hemolysin secretion protein D [Rhizobium sp. Root482]
MSSPSQSRLRLPFLFLPVFAALALSACSQEKAEAPQVVRPVKVIEIARADNIRELHYAGAVRARTEMNLGFRVAGKITERLVDIGQRVKAGDPLARIDPTDYELAVNSAKASLDAAERQVETAQLARSRAEQLFAKNVSPKAQLEQAVLNYDQAVATRDTARSSLDQAKNQVRYAELRSDHNGIVTAVNADIGQVVGSGTPVLTVAVDGGKEVLIAVPETEIAQFKPGNAVEVRFWSSAKLVLEGKIREIAGSADPQSRTFAVRISLPDDPGVLLGMTAGIEATVEAGPQTVSLPLSALAQQDDRPIVWRVDRAEATVHAHPVEIAGFTDDGVRIAKGLEAGDMVVSAGTQFMTEGLKVKIGEQPGHETASTATGNGALLR